MSWYKNWGGGSSRSTSSSWGSRSWGSWGDIYDKEDNSNLIVAEPMGYLTPTKTQISNKLQYGNRYTGFYSSRETLKAEEEEFVKNFSRFFYHDMIGEEIENVFIDEYKPENISSLNDEQKAKYENYKQAFDRVSDVKVPFYTPLEKSIFYLEMLKEAAKQQNKSMQEMMKELGQQMSNMEIDEDNLNNKDVNEILDRMLGQHQEDCEDGDGDLDDLFGDQEGEGEGQGNGSGNGEDGEGDGEGKESWGGKQKDQANNNNGSKDQKQQKGNGGNKGGDSTPETMFRNVIEHYSNRSNGQSDLTKSELLKKISKISDFGDQFAIEKEVITKATNNSRQRRNVRMTSFEQIPNVEIIQRILPDFDMKLATQSLRVDSPIKTTEHKQKIIVLIDRSGSMSSGNKYKWIMAFLADRLKSVCEEEAEIFVSNFEQRVEDLHFYHAYDKESALKMMKEYSWYPNGGDTHIGDMINHIADEINNKGKLHNLKVDLSKEKVEILVINDGQDSVKSKNLPWKTNALTLCDGINNELKSLCLKTGGKYIFIQHDGQIQEFE